MSEELNAFGNILMRKVRDEAIEEWDKILDGRLTSDRAVRVREHLRPLSPDQMAQVKWLVPQVVDSCLHHLLWSLEQTPEAEFKIRLASGLSSNLREVSDGLAGELYGPAGWIAKFSEQRHVPPVT